MSCFICALHRGTIDILEPARRGARKINASTRPAVVTSAMRAHQAADRALPSRSVPLAIRRAAKAFFAYTLE